VICYDISMSIIDSDKAVFFAKENARVIEHLICNRHEPILVSDSKLPYHVIYRNFSLDISVKIDYFIDCLNGQINIGDFQVVFVCYSYSDFTELYSQCVEIATLIKESGIETDFFTKPKGAFLYTKNELVCTESAIGNMNASISYILIFNKKLNFLITGSSYFGNPDGLSIELKVKEILSIYTTWKDLFNGNEIYSLPETKFFPNKIIVGTNTLPIKDFVKNK